MALWQKFREARQADRLSPEEYFEKLKKKGLNADGTPILDPVPLAPPIGYKKHPSMVEIVRDMVRGERLRAAAEEAGAETFEEADDFDVGEEDPLMQSGFENDFDPPIRELTKIGKEELDRKERERLDKEEKEAQARLAERGRREGRYDDLDPPGGARGRPAPAEARRARPPIEP